MRAREGGFTITTLRGVNTEDARWTLTFIALPHVERGKPKPSRNRRPQIGQSKTISLPEAVPGKWIRLS
jgi:hypothetical protein